MHPLEVILQSAGCDLLVGSDADVIHSNYVNPFFESIDVLFNAREEVPDPDRSARFSNRQRMFGIGRAIALLLAKRGAAVCVNYAAHKECGLYFLSSEPYKMALRSLASGRLAGRLTPTADDIGRRGKRQ